VISPGRVSRLRACWIGAGSNRNGKAVGFAHGKACGSGRQRVLKVTTEVTRVTRVTQTLYAAPNVRA
jgi:hypothetical protein